MYSLGVKISLAMGPSEDSIFFSFGGLVCCCFFFFFSKGRFRELGREGIGLDMGNSYLFFLRSVKLSDSLRMRRINTAKLWFDII